MGEDALFFKTVALCLIAQYLTAQLFLHNITRHLSTNAEEGYKASYLGVWQQKQETE
jgi:hypothetical protein